MYPSLPVVDNEGNTVMLNGFPQYLMQPWYPQLMVSDDGASLDDATMALAMDRAMVASKNHRDAERRRRERIKSHLDHLRCVLACSPKTDKASLLAKAVERVKHLNQQASHHISDDTNLLPTATDEIVVIPISVAGSSGCKTMVFRASFCCEDRPNLLTDITDTLHSLQLTILRAEMATLGGRIRNDIVVAKEFEVNLDDNAEGAFLVDALKSLIMPSEDKKRRRFGLRNSE